ncbi:TolC family protein [Bacteroides sp. 519]|uniref:TolC family protein n=1 Tax=Bacteroides sp. 519 TaxID=2302937 RepID=UPI001EF2F2CA|nr:TolC family protein [Bacteroides sp. 519]
MIQKFIFAFVLLISSSIIYAQTASLEDVLSGIEANNKQLQANKQETIVQKLEAKTDNNLPDPTVSYAHMWGKHNSNETISEMVVSQSFDFPTLYATRSKMNKLRMGAFDSQAESFRRDLLLQAKEVCLDIIMLRQQKQILDERLKNAQALSDMYAQRLQNGDASILETNKINLELLNVKTEANLNTSALNNKLQELAVLNGNNPINFVGTDYPVMVLPPDYETLRSEVLASDMSLYALDREAAASRVELNLNKSQWLPKLELGYRRNTESGNPFNGFVVGFSVPLFENRNKVKMARAQSLNLNYQKENKTLEIESELAQQYREAQTVRSSMEEYEKTFAAQSDLELLKQALMGGEISMIEYFVEVSVVYQSKINYIQLQNQYQKVMAKIYKHRL